MSDNILSNKEIKETVIFITSFRDSNVMQKLKIKSEKKYIMKMNNTFYFFKLNYPSIYDLIIKNENLDYLYKMFDMKDEIDSGRGKDKETIEKELGELLAAEYLYPVTDKLSK